MENDRFTFTNIYIKKKYSPAPPSLPSITLVLSLPYRLDVTRMDPENYDEESG